MDDDIQIPERDEHRNKVYSLLYNTENIKNLDEGIIEELLNSWKEYHGIIPLMKSLIVFGNPDVSEKAFSRISDIRHNPYESAIFAELCKVDEKKYGKKVKQVIQNIKDDDLISETTIRCVIATGNPDFIEWHKNIRDKKKGKETLNEISCGISAGFYDRINPVLQRYLKEI